MSDEIEIETPDVEEEVVEVLPTETTFEQANPAFTTQAILVAKEAAELPPEDLDEEEDEEDEEEPEPQPEPQPEPTPEPQPEPTPEPELPLVEEEE